MRIVLLVFLIQMIVILIIESGDNMKKLMLFLITSVFLVMGIESVNASSISVSDLSYEAFSPIVYQLFEEGESEVTIPDSYCSDPNFVKPFKLLGRIFSVIKIIIPIIIIAFGVVDFFKAVIASKDEEIKKSTKSLIMRLIAGVCIFFLPAIIHFIFTLVDDWNDYETDYAQCSLCITSPGKC